MLPTRPPSPQLPLTVLEGALFSLIMYFMVGYYRSASYFFTFYLVAMCVSASLSGVFRCVEVSAFVCWGEADGPSMPAWQACLGVRTGGLVSGRRHGHACPVSCLIARLSGMFRCVEVWTCVGCMCDS